MMRCMSIGSSTCYLVVLLAERLVYPRLLHPTRWEPPSLELIPVNARVSPHDDMRFIPINRIAFFEGILPTEQAA